MSKYFIEQKVTAFANQYKVFKAEGDNKGELIAFVHQKRLSMRENILFYKDEKKQELLFQVKTKNIVEVSAVYQVLDENDKLLGRLKKNFSSSLLRSTWSLLPADADDALVTVTERSNFLAIFRRLWDFVPFIGDLPFFFKYHFDFIDAETKQVIGAYEKTTLIYDHYKLEASEELDAKFEWRVLVAMGVCLDALQSR